jgi:hypothetical protein
LGDHGSYSVRNVDDTGTGFRKENNASLHLIFSTPPQHHHLGEAEETISFRVHGRVLVVLAPVALIHLPSSIPSK